MEYRLCCLNELVSGKPSLFHVAGKKLAVIRLKETVVAFSPFCPHARANLFHGRYEGTSVVCHWHGWSFDLLTGKGTNNDSRLQTYPVVVREEDVFVQIEDELAGENLDDAYFMPEIRWKNEDS